MTRNYIKKRKKDSEDVSKHIPPAESIEENEIVVKFTKNTSPSKKTTLSYRKKLRKKTKVQYFASPRKQNRKKPNINDEKLLDYKPIKEKKKQTTTKNRNSIQDSINDKFKSTQDGYKSKITNKKKFKNESFENTKSKHMSREVKEKSNVNRSESTVSKNTKSKHTSREVKEKSNVIRSESTVSKNTKSKHMSREVKKNLNFHCSESSVSENTNNKHAGSRFKKKTVKNMDDSVLSENIKDTNIGCGVGVESKSNFNKHGPSKKLTLKSRNHKRGTISNKQKLTNIQNQDRKNNYLNTKDVNYTNQIDKSNEKLSDRVDNRQSKNMIIEEGKEFDYSEIQNVSGKSHDNCFRMANEHGVIENKKMEQNRDENESSLKKINMGIPSMICETHDRSLPIQYAYSGNRVLSPNMVKDFTSEIEQSELNRKIEINTDSKNILNHNQFKLDNLNKKSYCGLIELDFPETLENENANGNVDIENDSIDIDFLKLLKNLKISSDGRPFFTEKYDKFDQNEIKIDVLDSPENSTPNTKNCYFSSKKRGIDMHFLNSLKKLKINNNAGSVNIENNIININTFESLGNSEIYNEQGLVNTENKDKSIYILESLKNSDKNNEKGFDNTENNGINMKFLESLRNIKINSSNISVNVEQDNAADQDEVNIEIMESLRNYEISQMNPQSGLIINKVGHPINSEMGQMNPQFSCMFDDYCFPSNSQLFPQSDVSMNEYFLPKNLETHQMKLQSGPNFNNLDYPMNFGINNLYESGIVQFNKNISNENNKEINNFNLHNYLEGKNLYFQNYPRMHNFAAMNDPRINNLNIQNDHQIYSRSLRNFSEIYNRDITNHRMHNLNVQYYLRMHNLDFQYDPEVDKLSYYDLMEMQNLNSNTLGEMNSLNSNIFREINCSNSSNIMEISSLHSEHDLNIDAFSNQYEPKCNILNQNYESEIENKIDKIAEIKMTGNTCCETNAIENDINESNEIVKLTENTEIKCIKNKQLDRILGCTEKSAKEKQLLKNYADQRHVSKCSNNDESVDSYSQQKYYKLFKMIDGINSSIFNSCEYLLNKKIYLILNLFYSNKKIDRDIINKLRCPDSKGENKDGYKIFFDHIVQSFRDKTRNEREFANKNNSDGQFEQSNCNNEGNENKSEDNSNIHCENNDVIGTPTQCAYREKLSKKSSLKQMIDSEYQEELKECPHKVVSNELGAKMNDDNQMQAIIYECQTGKFQHDSKKVKNDRNEIEFNKNDAEIISSSINSNELEISVSHKNSDDSNCKQSHSMVDLVNKGERIGNDYILNSKNVNSLDNTDKNNVVDSKNDYNSIEIIDRANISDVNSLNDPNNLKNTHTINSETIENLLDQKNNQNDGKNNYVGSEIMQELKSTKKDISWADIDFDSQKMYIDEVEYLTYANLVEELIELAIDKEFLLKYELLNPDYDDLRQLLKMDKKSYSNSYIVNNIAASKFDEKQDSFGENIRTDSSVIMQSNSSECKLSSHESKDQVKEIPPDKNENEGILKVKMDKIRDNLTRKKSIFLSEGLKKMVDLDFDDNKSVFLAFNYLQPPINDLLPSIYTDEYNELIQEALSLCNEKPSNNIEQKLLDTKLSLFKELIFERKTPYEFKFENLFIDNCSRFKNTDEDAIIQTPPQKSMDEQLESSSDIITTYEDVNIEKEFDYDIDFFHNGNDYSNKSFDKNYDLNTENFEKELWELPPNVTIFETKLPTARKLFDEQGINNLYSNCENKLTNRTKRSTNRKLLNNEYSSYAPASSDKVVDSKKSRKVDQSLKPNSIDNTKTYLKLDASKQARSARGIGKSRNRLKKPTIDSKVKQKIRGNNKKFKNDNQGGTIIRKSKIKKETNSDKIVESKDGKLERVIHCIRSGKNTKTSDKIEKEAYQRQERNSSVVNISGKKNKLSSSTIPIGHEEKSKIIKNKKTKIDKNGKEISRKTGIDLDSIKILSLVTNSGHDRVDISLNEENSIEDDEMKQYLGRIPSKKFKKLMTTKHELDELTSIIDTYKKPISRKRRKKND